MNPVKKLYYNWKKSALRYRIMISVIFSAFVTMAITIFMASLFSRIMEETGDSFKTNAVLDKYLSEIAEVENAMESYMRYRTFESIDKFYNYQAAAETSAELFHSNPSTIEIFQKEFIIRQLSLSFFDLSQKAIAARRANKAYDAELYFSKSMDCYSYLRKRIVELDMLCFTRNAKNYKFSKAHISTIIGHLLVALIIMLAAVVLVLYISIYNVTKPLAQISQVALRVAERDFDVPLFNTNNEDEIGNICRAFDAMIISIREYIDAIWERAMKENELREKEIEIRALYTEAHLKALQDQIKPHFLFNTLNTGAQLAMIEGADKTCYFLEQVADFLRYNIQHPGSDATIGEELGMLDNYIYIMKVRFGERYQFIKEIDESVLNIKMPNMILQPLVENCMKHGLKDITENGRIKISVRQNSDFIEISISDNGTGFDENVKKRIMEDAQKGGSGVALELTEKEKGVEDSAHVSAGLVNVISRLQLYFKYDDVFSILANDDPECGGKGTVFFIKIKKQK